MNDPRELPVSDISTGTRVVSTNIEALQKIATFVETDPHINEIFGAESDDKLVYAIVVAEARELESSTSIRSLETVSDVGPDRYEIYDVLEELGFKDDIFEDIRVSILWVFRFLDSNLTMARNQILRAYLHSKEIDIS